MLNVKQGSFYASTALGLQHVGPLEFLPKAVIFWWTKQVPTAGDQFDPGLSMGIGFGVDDTEPSLPDILDSFTRGDEGPPMTGWSAWVSSGLKVLSNQCAPADGGDNGAYYNTSMPADVDWYVTIATQPIAGGETVVVARLDPAAGTGYQVSHSRLAGTDTISISRKDPGGDVLIGGPWDQELSDGGKLRIRCSGSTIEAWASISGVWKLVGSTDDSTYAGTGSNNKVALFNFGNGGTGARYDDAGGGPARLSSCCALAIASDDNVGSSNAGRSHRDAKCITFLAGGTPTVDGEAGLVLLGETITLDWTDAPSSAWLVHYMALGGDELEAAHLDRFRLNTATGNQAVSGVGFKPDCVIFATVGSNSAPPADVAGLNLSIGAAVSASERGFSAIGEADASNPSSVVRYQLSAKALAKPLVGSLAWEFDFVSRDADGFTINIGTTGAGQDDYVFYLALRGGRYSVKPQVQPTSAANPPYEIGFKPSGVFLTSVGAVASGSRDTAAAKLSIGGGDGTLQGFVWGQSVDNVSPTDANVASWIDRALVLATSPATVDVHATIDAGDTGKPFWPTGYQLVWSTFGTANEFIGLAVGPRAKPRALLGVLASSGATPTNPGPTTDLLTPRLFSGLWFQLATIVLGPASSLQVDLETSPDGSTNWQTVASQGLLTAARYVNFAHVQVDRYVRLKPVWAGSPDSTSSAFVYATAASPAWYTT